MHADWILVGGTVLTCDDQGSIHEGVAMGEGKILAVGDRDRVLELRGPRTEVVDLGGRAAMPGIIDSHGHVIGQGMNRRGVKLKYPCAASIEDIQSRIAGAARDLAPGTWIKGWGYDHSKLREQRHPTRQDLDMVAPRHPVAITRTCGHIAVVNSRALELARIPEDIADPPGGRFGRDGDSLNGVVYGTAMVSLRDAWAPSLDDIKGALSTCSQDLLENGITTVHDAGSADGFARALSEMATSGELKVRVNMMVTARDNDPFQQARVFAKSGLTTGFGNDFARIGAYKVIVDGSSSGPTSHTRQPYTSNPGDTGILYVEAPQVDELIEEGHAAGYQVTAHAVGDRAIEIVIDAIEKAMKKYPRPNCRHRIEHCAICPPDLQQRIIDLGIVPVAQPVFFHEFGDGYLQNYGPERVRHMFPARSFLDQGVMVAASSDFPVTTMDPMLGIYQALRRQTVRGESCFSEETVDLAQALRMYTYNGAYASFEESFKGTLEPGKVADLAILSDDIARLPVEEIKDLVVDMTFVDGDLAYQRGD